MVEKLDDFRQRLEDHLPGLTKSQRRIASYLLAGYDEAAFLSAADLAERLDVSQATVVRFAQAVGYDGFPELRRCLQELFRAKATPASRLQRKLSELASSQGHVLTNMFDMEVQYLTEASHSIKLADFDRAVDILLSGRRIFVFGSGPSAILADLAELRLRRIGVLTISMTESGRHLLEKLQLLRQGDVVLATGFQQVRSELVAVLDYAHTLGCRAILLTDILGTALRGKADVVLAARRGPVSTFHSLTVPMSVLNALILGMAMARHDESLAALNRLEQMRIDYNLDVPVQMSSQRSPTEDQRRAC
ncbi:MAG: MurR/RpiR family transcriptional regulator [Anaerolineae bacterium]|nr:MurR/RpiR family transcriptional regulator [Anaerolineae bacterium]